MTVPFFRVELGEAEIAEVVETLRSGWLTTGPKTRQFEEEFAESVGAPHALALNSCTAALHVAVEALGLGAGDGVLVPTMTFAATAEVVRYLGAVPVLVDCEPDTCNLDLVHAEQILADHTRGIHPPGLDRNARIAGVMPVHFGGDMVDVAAVRDLAARHGLWIVEDAAHAFPAAWRPSDDSPWQRCGEGTADVTCFSFYANKTITTGEGGMAVTSSAALAERMKRMSLHGLSRDAWDRYHGGGPWDYRILAAGYKYNLTDIASAIGLHQLRRAEALRQERETRAGWYTARLASWRNVVVPSSRSTRRHAWHLYAIQLRAGEMAVTRNQVMEALRADGVTASVHWRPLHLHPYYQERFGYTAAHCPSATAVFDRNLSLPLFPGLTVEEVDYVVAALGRACDVPAAV